jgi:methylated-DNA-[protein]-cysteine S-methyltransferase
MTLAIAMFDSPLGPLALCGREDQLVGLYLPNHPLPDGLAHTTPVLARTAGQLAEYFAGTRTAFELPLAPDGTAFQRLVWDQLVAIPHGETRSYGQIAAAIGRPAASRAVGAANGKTPIAIVIPCHRVIGADGSLTGYGGGMPAKQWLLAHERRQLGFGDPARSG